MQADWTLISKGKARHNALEVISDADRTAMLDLARSAIEKYIAWENCQTLASMAKIATVYIASATPGHL